MRGVRRRRRQHGGSLPNRLADIKVDAICTFHRGEEGFNGISSIKTDIYYRLGWVWFAAISKWTQDYARTGSTFQNKPQPQVSFSNIRPVPTGSPDPRDSFIKPRSGGGLLHPITKCGALTQCPHRVY